MILIYTKPNCSYCVHAKTYLNDKKISFIEYKLDEDFNRDMIKQLYPSAQTYPVIVMDGEYIGGFVDLKSKIDKIQNLDSGEWNGC